MTPPGAWVLAIDFGTTNTVAAVGDANGVRTLTIDGRPVMPSAVFLNDTSRSGKRTWLVGEAAVRFARRRLERFEPRPKRAIADRSLFLGGEDVPVAEAITAVFRPIVQEAAQQHGGRPPAVFVVTHPATWANARIQILLEAAMAATEGLRTWPNPNPLAEPVAAAQRTLDIATVPPVARLVVLDLGGGTVDVTVVDRDGDIVTVVGRPSGIESLGGEDFDLRLARWMTAEAGAPGLYDRLAASSSPEERERAVEIRESARVVKEQLSREPMVPAQLPKSPPELPENTPVQVNKPELENLIRGGDTSGPGLTDVVDLVAQALRNAPSGQPLSGVFLVGGSSRIPLLGALVTERIGQVPLTHGDPTTAVADGAARYAWATHNAQVNQPPPVPPPVRQPPAQPAVPPPTPPSRRKKRTVPVLVAMLTLIALGVTAYVVASSQSASTGTSVTLSTSIPKPTTSKRNSSATPQAATKISRCANAGQAGCAAIILDTSRKAWPAISGLKSCKVNGSDLEAFEKYNVECTSGDLTYYVVWRRSLSDPKFPATESIRAQMPDPDVANLVTSSREILGVLVEGRLSDGLHYTCAAEYERYPVAMLLVGTDARATSAKCSTVEYNDNSELSGIIS